MIKLKKFFLSFLFVFGFLSIIKAYGQDSRVRLNEFMNRWLGAPYRYAGNTLRGIDCSALTQRMAKEVFGQDIPRTAKQQMKSVDQIILDSIQTGDLIFFRSSASPSGYHVGFYLWDGKFMHAASKKLGVIISELSDRTYLMIGRITPSIY